MNYKLPLRFRILHLLIHAKGPISVHAIQRELANEYGGEGQFSQKHLDNHLLSMKAVGLISGTDPFFDDHGQVHEMYLITDFGRSRVPYLPIAWRD
jgi:DNA-binding PadR family transcriptional regulator